MTRYTKAEEKKIGAFAEKVAARIDAVVARLVSVVDRMDSEMASESDGFDYFVDATKRLLEQRSDGDALAGAGYAADYLGSGRAPAMVWWVWRAGGVTERAHSADPESESFYDYTALRWFRSPMDTGAPALSGPFIDTWGSDDYTVTVSLPVSGEQAPRGVLAADVDVSRLIESLAADLASISGSLALVNESDRVLVSTVPSLSTGLPIVPRAARADIESVVRKRFTVPGYGWSVVLLA